MGPISLAAAVTMTAVLLNPSSPVACDTVDLVEVNHFYDEEGKPVFDQIIFYDWRPDESRYHVCDWRLLKQPAQVPQRNWKTGEFVAVWHDGEVFRQVRSQAFRETWTQYDPELVEREFLPKEKRRELRQVNFRPDVSP